MTTLSSESHWTGRSTEDFLFRIGSDFIAQLEEKMGPMTQVQLAKKLGVSEGRVSQFLNNPGNLTLSSIIEYSRVLGLKVSVMVYDDDDPKNKKGPINSDVFRICWEKAGKPKDFWAFEDIEEAGNATDAPKPLPSDRSNLSFVRHEDVAQVLPVTAANEPLALAA